MKCFADLWTVKGMKSCFLDLRFHKQDGEIVIESSERAVTFFSLLFKFELQNYMVCYCMC